MLAFDNEASDGGKELILKKGGHGFEEGGSSRLVETNIYAGGPWKQGLLQNFTKRLAAETLSSWWAPRASV